MVHTAKITSAIHDFSFIYLYATAYPSPIV